MSLAALPVIVMSKLPVAGRVKTRLTPALTPQQAAEVHRLFLLHLLDRLIDLAPAELVVCFDPPDAGASMAALLSPRSLQLIAQSEGDLGNRLAIAANSIFERFDRVLFLGVDSPDVPVALLQNAAELTAGSDVVLGPTLDGGFWCLGLRRGIDVASVLSDIPWSSGGEREATIRRAASLGYSTAAAGDWDDVDYADDLHQLHHRLTAAADPLGRQLDQVLTSDRSSSAPLDPSRIAPLVRPAVTGAIL